MIDQKYWVYVSWGAREESEGEAAVITYIPTRQGWLYLAIVIDLFSRKVVGWSMSHRIYQLLVIDALKMAIQDRRPPPGLIFHSDRGSQYASDDFQKLLVRHGMICSMSRKANCWDNAVAESFFGTVKTELVHHEDFQTRDEARLAIFEYIAAFYNRIRRHSTLGYLSPMNYEELMQSQTIDIERIAS